ncbi:MAG: GTP-binding protein [Planctomycetota bacterium]
MAQAPKTPCHIVAGPLGVGKTSAILNYLRRNASSRREGRVGVLVNDFGPVGLDSTTLAAEAPATTVLNVPGGCICCTMLAELPERIRQLSDAPDIDQIIIEPSGMAAPAQVIDLLRGTQQDLGISLEPAIAMLSVGDFDQETFERMGYYRMFYESADILVFNRCDQAKDDKIERARQWAEQLDPPKLRVITTAHGELPPEVFEPSAEPPACTDAPHNHAAHDHEHDHEHTHHDHGHDHNHDHDHDHDHDPTIHPGGFVIDADRRFDEEVLMVNLMRVCHQGIADNRVLRLKGVFQTQAGWQSIEIANREVSFRPSAHRRDNRLEWITQPNPIDPDQMLTEIDRTLDWQDMARSLDID